MPGAHGRDAVGAEPADRHQRREPVVAVHEIEQIGGPDDGDRGAADGEARAAARSPSASPSIAAAPRRRRARPAHERRGEPRDARPASRRRRKRPSRPPTRRARPVRCRRDGGQQRHRQKACPDRDSADAGHGPVVQRTLGGVVLRQPAAPARQQPRARPRKAPPRESAPARANTANTLIRARRRRPAPARRNPRRDPRWPAPAAGKPVKIDDGGGGLGPNREERQVFVG